METTILIEKRFFVVDDWFAPFAKSLNWTFIQGHKWPQYRGLFLPQYALGGTRGEIQSVDGNTANCTQANLRVKPNKYVRWRSKYEKSVRRNNVKQYDFTVDVFHGPADGFVHWYLDTLSEVYVDHLDVTWLLSADSLTMVAYSAPWVWVGRELVSQDGRTLPEVILGHKTNSRDLRLAR